MEIKEYNDEIMKLQQYIYKLYGFNLTDSLLVRDFYPEHEEDLLRIPSRITELDYMSTLNNDENLDKIHKRVMLLLREWSKSRTLIKGRCSIDLEYGNIIGNIRMFLHRKRYPLPYHEALSLIYRFEDGILVKKRHEEDLAKLLQVIRPFLYVAFIHRRKLGGLTFLPLKSKVYTAIVGRHSIRIKRVLSIAVGKLSFRSHQSNLERIMFDVSGHGIVPLIRDVDTTKALIMQHLDEITRHYKLHRAPRPLYDTSTDYILEQLNQQFARHLSLIKLKTC
jgi:hypothetical protein